jgi:endo-1,4-beta-xylanase
MLSAQGKDSDSLRFYADKMNFWVGTTIQGKFFSEPAYQQALGHEFNSGVSINLMRMTQPERGRFDFGNMDRDIKFARAHNMKLFGQALVYRNNTSPDWMRFQGGNCGGMSEDQLDKIMKEHIQTLVRHGGDDFYGWEVVNETFAPPDQNGCWSKIFGQEKLISKAFQYAREAGPNAMLLLNETFGRDGLDKGKMDTFFKLVRKLKSQGVPIDAVGAEMHLEADQLKSSYMDEFQYFLDSARKAEVQAMVTEMDVYQGHAGAFSDNIGHQKEVFYNVAHACVKDSNCKGFTVWGLSDKGAWQPTWRGITDTKPLLFDDNFQKKPAYFGVLQALKEGR